MQNIGDTHSRAQSIEFRTTTNHEQLMDITKYTGAVELGCSFQGHNYK